MSFGTHRTGKAASSADLLQRLASRLWMAGGSVLLAVMVTCLPERPMSSSGPPPPPWIPPEVAALPRVGPDTPVDVVTFTLMDPPEHAPGPVPIDTGLPLPMSLQLYAVEGLALKDSSGRFVPVQIEPRVRWGGAGPDDATKPLRWIALRFLAELPAKGPSTYTLCYGGERPAPARTVRVESSAGAVRIDTGVARLALSEASPDLFTAASLGGRDLIGPGNGFVLTGPDGVRRPVLWTPGSLQVGPRGPLMAGIHLRGTYETGVDGRRLEVALRLRFFAGEAHPILDFTLHNPAAAEHTGNVWPLGDPGSVRIPALSLELPVPGASRYALSAEGKRPIEGQGDVTLLQASSGRPTWRSSRHVDATGHVPLLFRGYRIMAGERELDRGNQARPVLRLAGLEGAVTAVVEDFWQTFPKSIGTRGDRLVVGLFPPLTYLHELQGGEQTTHRVHLWLEPVGDADRNPARTRLEQAGAIHVRLPSSWWLASRATFGDDRPRGALQPGSLEATLDSGVHVHGHRAFTFESLADARDAYGWREWGDVQADHETECGRQSGPDFVSHYNNQYDYVLGAFHQFGRTGDPDWLRFALRTAAHTTDIDIYHTRDDKIVYNGGMFWHTTHDSPAGTSSHRSFPPRQVSRRCTSYQSGGPGLGHLYADGLAVAWALTGEPRYREGLVELAGFAINRRSVDRREADGRALGNYLRTLVTACEVIGEARFCDEADRIIPVVVRKMRYGSGWDIAILGRDVGRWLELDDQRLRLSRGLSGAPATAASPSPVDANHRNGDVGPGASPSPLPVAGNAGRDGARSEAAAAPAPVDTNAGEGGAHAVDRALARDALIGLCERLEPASLPLDANRARYADVLAYCYRYAGAHPRATRWLRDARYLLQSLEDDWWAHGTYPTAKELAILLTNGGPVRALGPSPAPSGLHSGK